MRLFKPLASGTMRVSRLRSLFWARWCVVAFFVVSGMVDVAPAFAGVNAPTNSGTSVNAAPSNFTASNVDDGYACLAGQRSY